MKLRDYQAKARDSVLQAWQDGARTVAGRMFTGGGKTIVAADIIRDVLARNPGKCFMALAHRKELIWQAADKIKRHTGLSVEVEMGEYKASLDKTLFHPRADVIVSTVQTQTAGGDGGGRLGKFNPADFAGVWIDECHRAVSPSYRRTIDYYLTNPELVVFGNTATPDRADEKALGQVFEVVPDGFDYDMNYGRLQGWLAEIEQHEVHIDSLDFSAVRMNSEDLNGNDLAAVLEAEKPLYGIADATLQLAGDKRGIGFSPSVAHARMTANIFNRYRPGMAAFVHGGTDPEERRQINADFAAGKILWIWNCGTHIEGYDDCGVEFVVPKPTCSRAAYEQMIGRGSRVHDSIADALGNFAHAAVRRGLIARSRKPFFTVLDFYGNSGKHKLVTAFDILGGDMSPEAVSESIAAARRLGKSVRVGKTLEEEEKKQAEIKARQEAEASRKAKIVVKASYKTTKVDPFDVFAVKPTPKRGWDDGKELTEKQRGILRNAGFDPATMEYGRAKQLIGMILDRWANKKCTINQAGLLRRHGWSAAEVDAMSFDAAKSNIDALAKNGWTRPRPAQVFDTTDDVPF